MDLMQDEHKKHSVTMLKAAVPNANTDIIIKNETIIKNFHSSKPYFADETQEFENKKRKITFPKDMQVYDSAVFGPEQRVQVFDMFNAHGQAENSSRLSQIGSYVSAIMSGNKEKANPSLKELASTLGVQVPFEFKPMEKKRIVKIKSIGKVARTFTKCTEEKSGAALTALESFMKGYEEEWSTKKRCNGISILFMG
jgi:hypothetical protein